MANWYYFRDNALWLHIQLQPRARCNEIIGPHGDYLKIRITTPPLDGRANKHLIRFLAECFKVSQQQVIIEKGEQSRIKLVRIDSPNTLECIDENRFRK